MQSNNEENVSGNILMTLPEVELYYVKDGEHVLLEKSSLSIIYYATMSCFILQIGGFKYSLYKEIPVVASRNEKDGMRSYVLPNIEGYYVIRASSMSENPTIDTFETIFSQYVTLLEKADQPHEKNRTEKVSEMISTGGEIIKSGLIMGAELVAKGVMTGGEYIQNKFMKKSEDPQANAQALEKLEKVESKADTIIASSKHQLEKVKSLGLTIAETLKKQWSESSIGQTVENNKIFKTVKQIGKSTVYATGSILMGMLNALDIILKGIGKTATNMFHYKYGESIKTEDLPLSSNRLEQPLLSENPRSDTSNPVNNEIRNTSTPENNNQSDVVITDESNEYQKVDDSHAQNPEGMNVGQP